MSQRLLVYQAIWAMEGVPGIDLDADMAPALEMIAEAGFDGAGVNILRTARAEAVAQFMPAHGLTWEAMAAARSADEIAELAQRAAAMGAHHLNVQVTERTAVLEDAVALLADIEAVAANAPLPVYVETHRGRLTNDLLFMIRVLDALPDLKLTGDLSHYPVVHEFPLPVSPGDEPHPRKLLGLSRSRRRFAPGASLADGAATPALGRAVPRLVGRRLRKLEGEGAGRRRPHLPLRTRAAQLCRHRRPRP